MPCFPARDPNTRPSFCHKCPLHAQSYHISPTRPPSFLLLPTTSTLKLMSRTNPLLRPLPLPLFSLPTPRRTTHALLPLQHKPYLPLLAPRELLVPRNAKHNVLVVVAGLRDALPDMMIVSAEQSSPSRPSTTGYKGRAIVGIVGVERRISSAYTPHSDSQRTTSTSRCCRGYTPPRRAAAAAHSSLPSCQGVRWPRRRSLCGALGRCAGRR